MAAERPVIWFPEEKLDVRSVREQGTRRREPAAQARGPAGAERVLATKHGNRDAVGVNKCAVGDSRD